jgi:2-C-methyl-D-erythritol 4-phosphate cytidylyltransferase
MLSAIVVAAGQGKRLKGQVSKPLVKIGKLPVITYSLRVLEKHPAVDEIIVVANAKNQRPITKLIKSCSFKKVKRLVLGGCLRQDSVYQGLKAVSVNAEWVLIHDAARPFVDAKIITQVIRAAKKTGSAIAAVKPKATIKLSRDANLVKETLDRDNLWEVQTPQVFKTELILKAYKKYAKERVTDDAALVERLGVDVAIVEASYRNIKITTPEDLLFAGLIAKRG